MLLWWPFCRWVLFVLREPPLRHLFIGPLLAHPHMVGDEMWDLGFDRGLGLFGGFWLRGSVSLDFGWDFGRWLCWDFWWF
jgi:hypothetical protein